MQLGPLGAALLLRTPPDAFDPGRRCLGWRRRVYSRGQATTEHGGESAVPPPALQGRGAQQGSLSLALRRAPPQRLEATVRCAGQHRGCRRIMAMLAVETTCATTRPPPPGRHDHQAVNSGADWGSVQLAMVTLSTILVDVFSDIIYASS